MDFTGKYKSFCCTDIMAYVAVETGARFIAADGIILGLIPTDPQCVQITNECRNYTLCNPSVYTTSGNGSAPATIAPGTSDTALFTNTTESARGAVGVFTYDLHNKLTKRCTKKIAVMFSVPYDFNLSSNWYAVGVFDKCTKCDYDLYCKMYNGTERTFIRCKANVPSLTYSSDEVTIRATMSDSYQPVMTVHVI